MGIRNPKSFATSWAQGEKLTTAQAAAMLEHMRRTAMYPFLGLRPTHGMNTAVGGNRAQDICLSYNDKQAVFFGCGDFDENDIVQCTDLENDSWASSAPSLTASGNIHPVCCAAASNQSDHLVWFGIDRGSATSEGYIKNDGGTWSIVNRALAGTGLDHVANIWYWPEKDTFIASWDLVSGSHTLETNTADAGWVDRSFKLTGDYPIWRASMSPDHWVGVGTNDSDTPTTEIAVSSNGTSFTVLTLSQSKSWRDVCYDRTEGVWYLLANDWTLLTCSGNPTVAANWGEETNFQAPDNSPGVTQSGASATRNDHAGLIVQGGVICLWGVRLEAGDNDRTVLVSSDLGANWYMAAPESTPATIKPVMKILDGRLVYIAGYGSNEDTPYVGPRGLDPLISIT